MTDGDERADAAEVDAGERLRAAYAEPNPEDDLVDPESDLPNVPSVPSVEPPSPTRSERNVPDELLAGFWTTVLVFNVAVLGTSLGLLLLAFGSQQRLGIGALVVGLAAAAHGYFKYRSLAERHHSGEWTGESAGDDSPDREDGSNERPAGEVGEHNG